MIIIFPYADMPRRHAAVYAWRPAHATPKLSIKRQMTASRGKAQVATPSKKRKFILWFMPSLHPIAKRWLYKNARYKSGV